MRRIGRAPRGFCLPALLAVGLTSAPALAQAVPPEPDPILAGRAAPPGTYGDLDVLHYEVAIVLPPPGGTTIEGRATLTLRPLRPKLGRMALDLTGLAVQEARVDEGVTEGGFATYFGHLYFGSADGEEELRRRMEDSRRDYLASEVTGRPVIDRGEQDLFALLNANNYPKGGWILHMLRGIVGDEVFFRGIRGYYAAFSGGVATSADFRDVMENASGMDLDWFFRQWLEEPGYPVLGLEHRWDQEAGEVWVTVVQEQDPGWPTFRLPMEIEVVLDDGIRQRHGIDVRRRRETFRLRLAGRPAEVNLDPGGWVLKG